MCGIAGYLGSPLVPSPIDEAALLSSLRHRGPDEQGRLRFQTRAGTSGLLVSTRLAIVDLSPEASQPMRSRDGRLALSFNGEIYNHRTLRAELVAEGAQLQSHSDTEVILAGYARWGDRLWSRLRGMFALALWDASDDALRLLRDPMGQKPLYLTCAGPSAAQADLPSETTRLCFASELRTLLLAGAVPRRIDPVALTGFLTWGSVPEPGCVVAGARLLPAGQMLRVRCGRARLQLDPLQPIEAPSADVLSVRLAASLADRALPATDDRREALRRVLAETLRGHLQGDVPVGILLSGGVDSACVAAWARHVAPTQDLLAFTLDTGLPGSEAEVAQARATAQALRLQHQITPISTDAAASAAPRWLAAQDQPTVDGGNTFLVCEQVRRAGCKVVLSGAGGDELFLGYGLHRRFAAAWAAYRALPSWLRGVHGLAADDRVAAWLYQRQRRLFPPALISSLLLPALRHTPVLPVAPEPGWIVDSTAALPDASPAFAEGLARVQAFEARNYLRHTLLRDGDMLSMAHSVELRLPLCDPWLWRAMQTLDPLLPTGARRKSLLVAAAPPGDFCVAQAARQPKRGFDLPLDAWLRGPLRQAVAQHMTDEALLHRAGLWPRSIQRLWSAYLALQASPAALRRRLSHRIWALHVWLAYVQKQALRFDASWPG